jgi:hypothetical protein
MMCFFVVDLWPASLRGCGVSSEALAGFLGGVVGAAAALLATGVTLLTEGKRRREDARRDMEFRRDQYFVESSADISDRVWAFVYKLEAIEAEEGFGWEPVYDITIRLRDELSARRPRFRLAGIEPAVMGIIDLLGHFLKTRAFASGQADAQDTFERLLKEYRQPADSPPAAQEAMRRYRQRAYEQLKDSLRATLTAVADYDHGRPFEVPKPREPWASFGESLEQVQAESQRP